MLPEVCALGATCRVRAVDDDFSDAAVGPEDDVSSLEVKLR